MRFPFSPQRHEKRRASCHTVTMIREGTVPWHRETKGTTSTTEAALNRTVGSAFVVSVRCCRGALADRGCRDEQDASCTSDGRGGNPPEAHDEGRRRATKRRCEFFSKSAGASGVARNVRSDGHHTEPPAAAERSSWPSLRRSSREHSARPSGEEDGTPHGLPPSRGLDSWRPRATALPQGCRCVVRMLARSEAPRFGPGRRVAFGTPPPPFSRSGDACRPASVIVPPHPRGAFGSPCTFPESEEICRPETASGAIKTLPFSRKKQKK
ncbi:hypothetical protein HPB51_014548 [Rhipicephalus microplus]|uniref:Uncharacterized protein n=1 Tax=Rhipicephalus microplus TaxID=6941 RepID=A0A9J6DN34_RHIMP|nr:hypothetical protein HPB51_014548 [Rhipicephalus microplus]